MGRARVPESIGRRGSADDLRTGMGHVLFAAPSIESFHLHERLARSLQRRGHRVTILAGESGEDLPLEAWGVWP